MGTVTISLNDETENLFRATVKAKYGEGKGKLGKAVEEALSKWVEDKEAGNLRRRALEKLKTGLYRVGKNYTFKREEAYGERVRKASIN